MCLLSREQMSNTFFPRGGASAVAPLKKKFYSLSRFKVLTIIRSFILSSTLRVSGWGWISWRAACLAFPPCDSLTCKEREYGWQDTTSCRLDQFEDQALCSLIPWMLAEGSVRVLCACTRTDRVAQGHRKWNISVRCAAPGISSLMDSRSLAVSAQRNQRSGVREPGSWPVLSAAFF